MPTPRRIAIVGAGYTGALLAANLIRSAGTPLALTLIDPAADRGPGLAYTTPSGSHLLNVRAANMSAYADQPRHFVEWLARRGDGADGETAFVPRVVYGDYLCEVLAQARRGAPAHVEVSDVYDRVEDIAEEAGVVVLRLGGGAELRADEAVLCLGNFPPSPPPGVTADLAASPRFVGNPWDFAAIAGLPKDRPVLVLGTGLTMVDAVLALDDAGHPGPFLALSRRGLRPQVHAPVAAPAEVFDPDRLPTRTADLVRRVREAAGRTEWRAVVDSLRPYTHRLWQGLPLEERRRFLRHVRPYWDIHRHRIAPAVAARLAAWTGWG